MPRGNLTKLSQPSGKMLIPTFPFTGKPAPSTRTYADGQRSDRPWSPCARLCAQVPPAVIRARPACVRTEGLRDHCAYIPRTIVLRMRTHLKGLLRFAYPLV